MLPGHKAPPAVIVTRPDDEDIDEMLDDDFCEDEARVLAECQKIVDAKAVATGKRTDAARVGYSTVPIASIARTLPTDRSKDTNTYQPPTIDHVEQSSGGRKQAAKLHCSFCGKPGHLESACFNKTPCTHCSKPGHKSEDCYFKPAQSNISNPTGDKKLCTGCGKTGHVEAECRAKQTCGLCGRAGHKSSDCRSKPPASSCGNCGRAGHKTHECPRKGSQNRGRGGNVGQSGVGKSRGGGVGGRVKNENSVQDNARRGRDGGKRGGGQNGAGRSRGRKARGPR